MQGCQVITSQIWKLKKLWLGKLAGASHWGGRGFEKVWKTVLVVVVFSGHSFRLKNLLNSCLEVYALKYVLSADLGETQCWTHGCPKSTQVTSDAYLMTVFTQYLERAQQYGHWKMCRKRFCQALRCAAEAHWIFLVKYFWIVIGTKVQKGAAIENIS